MTVSEQIADLAELHRIDWENRPDTDVGLVAFINMNSAESRLVWEGLRIIAEAIDRITPAP